MNLRSPTMLLFFLLTSFYCIAQTESRNDTSNNNIDSNGVFKKVEVEAAFPGGQMAWRKFLEQNLRAAIPSENGAPAGSYTVWVQFIVDKEGLITDIKPLTNQGFGMEEEILRIMKLSPSWQPASQNGRAVKAYRRQSVTFQIEEDGFEVTIANPSDLYIGMDNHVTINCPAVKDKDLRVTISQGDITGKNGNYIVHVTNVGRAIIDIFDRKKKVGSYSTPVYLLPAEKKNK